MGDFFTRGFCVRAYAFRGVLGVRWEVVYYAREDSNLRPSA